MKKVPIKAVSITFLLLLGAGESRAMENLYDTIYQQEKVNYVEKAAEATKSDKADKLSLEACYRVQEWPKPHEERKKKKPRSFTDFKCAKKGKYADSDFDRLEKGQQIEDQTKVNWSKSYYNTWSGYVKDAVGSERSIMELENQLRDYTGQMSVNSNRIKGERPGGFKDADFDLIDDLDNIDEILFGEKHTRPEPSFAFKKSEGFNSGEEKAWQDSLNAYQVCTDPGCSNQPPPTNPKANPTTNPNTYSPGDSSIAGHLANMKEVVADGKDGAKALTSMSQAAECTSTRVFQPTFINLFLPDIADMHVQKIKKGGVDSTPPEVDSNAEENIGELFSAFEEQVITETSCTQQNEEDRNKYHMGAASAGQMANQCKQLKKERQKKQLDSISKASIKRQEKKQHQQITDAIQKWNWDFNAWYDQMVQLKQIFKELSEKPKCL